MTKWPEWTVFTNIDNGQYVGMCWEFFNNGPDASDCYMRHIALDHVPTMRPFHENDIQHMGMCHRTRCNKHTPPGFQQCTRAEGHPGPCAHHLVNKQGE